MPMFTQTYKHTYKHTHVINWNSIVLFEIVAVVVFNIVRSALAHAAFTLNLCAHKYTQIP